jgi:voltage-gated potassium channel
VSGLALAPGRFHLLLLSLLLFFGGTAAAAGSRVERAVEVSLLALVIIAAVLDLRERGHQRNLAIALAGGVIFVSAANLSARIKHLPAVAGALIVLFAGLVVWRAYTAVMRRQRSVRDRITGAVCVYVLIGLAWAKVYETLDDVAPGSFRFPADTEWVIPSSVRYSYYSFVTLASLGYGDVTPVTALTGTLAWMEAITGQLYLAITVARLVALSLADSSESK